MEVNQEVITHLAQLSNLAISEQENKRLVDDIKDIIKYISQLDELDTENVTPTYQVFEMKNVWRSDEIMPQEADREELLALTEETQDHQIKVPKVL